MALPNGARKRTTECRGTYQRGLARAFAGDPHLVVCDEPASALDVSVQASILNLLVELQTNEQTSYVFISHDLAVVRYISDRIGVMYLAELIEVGAAADVFDPPHHPYTEALLSSIPRLDFDKQRERIPLRGSMPSLTDPPTGCRFHTRCHRFLGDICVEQDAAGDGRRRRAHVQVPHPAGRTARLQLTDEPAPEPAPRLTAPRADSDAPAHDSRPRQARRAGSAPACSRRRRPAPRAACCLYGSE